MICAVLCTNQDDVHKSILLLQALRRVIQRRHFLSIIHLFSDINVLNFQVNYSQLRLIRAYLRPGKVSN